MSNEQDDNTIDLAEEITDLNERLDERDEIIDRHARIMTAYGCDFTDNGYIVVVDRELAVARLGEEAVKRLEAED